MDGQFWFYLFVYCYFVQIVVFKRLFDNCWCFFFYEFVEYFEFVVMFSDKLLIIGDFNIFMDVFIDCNNIYYRDFLEVMGFV